MRIDQKIRESFLSLLRIGLWGSVSESLSIFPLNKNEWTLVYKISISQTVEGIVYDGIVLLPKEYLPPYDILIRWTARIDAIERHNRNVRKTLSILSEGLKKNNISHILLKGIGLAENYNKPLSRVSGDIDLCFFSVSEFNQANELLKSKGFDVLKGDHFSSYYMLNSVMVEHHTKMIDIFNPLKQKLIKSFIAEERLKSNKIKIDNSEIETPSYILAHLQANAHILKHYLGFGIGLRQLCDVARLCYVKENNFDGNKLKEIYRKLGIAGWINATHNLLVNYLGLDASKLPYPIEKHFDSEPILYDVLYSGNFGFHQIKFDENTVSIPEKSYDRDNVGVRVLPHLLKLVKLAPGEVIWYPLNKLYTKLTGK
ncbi:nucleotidyltransferase domain-containing protein [Sphingobacterium bovistauri]|uniref:Nucleotidyltransferase family protein n=1 Tax=Sphingobacterium bovistauri TaxID=2781959 RepID=A0ABS7Z1S4_9SPHI|nr:nucleotidyltransferase family protein [Sphingobacterium bovistauri]MCA5004129.1 nucleotidyltransferase family protein [Sphingobacterium bovistauri]